MQITHENDTLLETTTFLALGLGVTAIKIGKDTESLTFLLDFASTDDGKQSLELKVVDDRTLQIVMKNWNNVLGSGLLEPLRVGVFAKQPLFLALFVQKAGSQGHQRLVTVSLYLRKESVDGKN